MSSGPIDHVSTRGRFNLDGGSFEVDNNVWVVGDADEVLVIDAAHDDEAIAQAVGGRRVVAVVCTHAPDRELHDGDVVSADGIDLRVLQTPGHSPGSSCLYAPELGVVFTGDTLFQGGPGGTGRSYSSFDTLMESSRTTLLTLPGDTRVRTGHGDSTTVGDEAPHLEMRIGRGA